MSAPSAHPRGSLARQADGFVSLEQALEGLFRLELAEMPADLRKRIGRALPYGGLWDALSPEQRRSAANQWDIKHDPALEEARARGWDEQAVDWSYWRSVSTLTAQEFCVLLHRHDPREFRRHQNTIPGGDGATLGSRVDDDTRRLRRVLGRTSRKSLESWIRSALRAGLRIPAYMIEAPIGDAVLLRVAPPADGVETGFSIRCEGKHCTLAHSAGQIVMKASKGLRYIEKLVAKPGMKIEAENLYRSINPPPASGLADGSTEGESDMRSDGVDALSGGASRVSEEDEVRQWRVELRKSEVAVADAEAHGDHRAAARHKKGCQDIRRHLLSIANVHGRPRMTSSAAEKLRKNIGNAIVRSIKEVSERAPEVGRHLVASVRTGTNCFYLPPK